MFPKFSVDFTRFGVHFQLPVLGIGTGYRAGLLYAFTGWEGFWEWSSSEGIGEVLGEPWFSVRLPWSARVA